MSQMPASFVYGQVALDFQVDGKPAKAVFKYKYFAADNTVEYVDIQYSDPKLKSIIENDPHMQQKINDYVMRQLANRNKGLS